MANTEKPNELNQVNKFKNQDSKIIISNLDYDTLLTQYNNDIDAIEGADNENDAIKKKREIWENLSKSILISAPAIDGVDKKQYQIIVFGPNGKPIAITPAFSEVDSKYFKITSDGKLTLADDIAKKIDKLS